MVTTKIVRQISRRQFLKFSGGAALGLAASPVLTAVAPPYLRAGILGLGERGLAMLRATQQCANLAVAYVSDADESALRSAVALGYRRKRGPWITAVRPAELWQRNDIDAVILCPAAGKRPAVASVPAAFAKILYLVPPLFWDLDDVDPMLNLLENQHWISHLHLPHLFDPNSQAALQRAHSTRFGALRSATIHVPFDLRQMEAAWACNELDLVVRAAADDGHFSCRSAVAEPRQGPSHNSVSLLVESEMADRSLRIDLVGCSGGTNSTVNFVGMHGQISCSVSAPDVRALDVFAMHALGRGPNRRGASKDETAPFTPPLLAAALAALAGDALRQRQPMELRFV